MTTPTDYAQIFGEDYKKAQQYVQLNKTNIEKVCKSHNIDSKKLVAIVFPELIRYSTFKDFFETTALEYAYTHSTTKTVDFSIGNFQMKPSFVEHLEQLVSRKADWNAPFQKITQFKKTDIPSQRAERLKRMQDKTWQLEYACCFYQYVTQHYKTHLDKLSASEQIDFLATVYNAGMGKSAEAIERWQQRTFFPYGTQHPEKDQYAYGKVARDYYEKNSK